LSAGPTPTPAIAYHGEARGFAPHAWSLKQHDGEVELADIPSKNGNALFDQECSRKERLIGTAEDGNGHGRNRKGHGA
jgi:hypothetical protein